jgi:hypothetical protein
MSQLTMTGGPRKRRFTTHEDLTILHMLHDLGVRDWLAISRALTHRTPRQCRERWRNYLRPAIDDTPWTPEEDALLAEQHRAIGPKWAHISRLFTGRTDINLRNRWARLARQRKNDTQPEESQSQSQSAPPGEDRLGVPQFAFPTEIECTTAVLQSIGRFMQPGSDSEG